MPTFGYKLQTMQKGYFLLTALALTVALLGGCVKGDTGPQGPAGTANMQSGIITGQYWVYSSTYNDYSITFSDAYITSDVLLYGAILHYYRPTGNSSWFSAPNSYVYTSDDVGGCTFYSPGSTDPGRSDFRIVVIAPDKMQGHTKQQWQSLNYEQVVGMLKN